VSEFDEPGLDELERELGAAFASTRPRRDFEDELWGRLQARRPWWRRVGPPPRRALPALGGLAAVVLVGFLLVTVFSTGVLQNGHGTSSSAAQSTAAGTASLPFGRLPRPPAGVAGLVPGGAYSQPRPATRATEGVPAVPPRLPVYRYTAAAGPANGTVLDPASLPPGLEAEDYPTLQPAEAARQAAPTARQGQAPEVTLTQARLVYVAVTDGAVGYLEPVYEVSGTAKVGDTTSPFSARVPALADSAFR
jgi:hypothetical protein